MSKQELLSYRSFISLVRQFYTFICKTSHKKFDFFIIHDSIYTKPIEEKALFMERWKKEGTADCTIGVYGKINQHEDLQLSLKEQ